MAVLSFSKKKKKTKKKPAKKKIVKRKAPKKKVVKERQPRKIKSKTVTKKKAVRKVPIKKAVKVKNPRAVVPNEEFIGKITHYFPHVKAAVVEVKQGGFSIGDTMHIKGHTTNFTQKVNSMQIDHVAISSANKGDEIGLMVKSRVRIHDDLFKLL